MLTAADITRFDDAPPPPGQSPYVGDVPKADNIEIVESDPAWPERFDDLAERIRRALGNAVLEIEHVGSTSVPGLPAKPIIDIDLTVPDSDAEAHWLPQLENAGFVLKIREPWWYRHRCLKHDAPKCNLHVFSPNCAETRRHRIFRDWLRGNAEDRDLYRDAKLAAAGVSNTQGERVDQYNARKQQVIREIYHRAFVSEGLI